MIVALQYYEGDRERTFALARLLADLEPSPRDDLLLALVCQPDTPTPESTNLTLRYCENKFPTIQVMSARGTPDYQEGCGQLWAGTMNYFYQMFEEGTTRHDSILTLDGGDGVPLHRNWFDLFKAEHDKTISSGKLVTGTPYNQGGCPLLINPNMASHLSLWKLEPSLREIPHYTGSMLTIFDTHHRQTLLKHTSLSSIVKTDWRGDGNKISLGLMRSRSEKSIWLHGYKDDSLYEVAREHLSNPELTPPALERYQLEQLRMVESAKGWFWYRNRPPPRRP